MKIRTCENCLHRNCSEDKIPCCKCKGFDLWELWELPIFQDRIAEQPQEEINHPDRYAGGKYECIDVMQDVFGVEAVKHFCMLNAFKYLWRADKKGGVNDVKKAVWYLNKYIELESEGEKE